MSRWIYLGFTAIALVCFTQDSNVEARGRNYGYCASCQYSMPTIALPAAQAPAPPVDDATEPDADDEPVVNGGNTPSYGNYYQNVRTRRVRWFGRFRN